MPRLDYNDTMTLYEVQNGAYKGKKIIHHTEIISCIFIQSTGFQNQANREEVTSDAICYPDFENDFIIANANRLEGMYILANPFNAIEQESWYKIIKVVINRSHLLDNQIDNIQMQLKKTASLVLIS